MRGKIADLKIYKKESLMSNKNIIRAWKDPVYRNSLSASERAALPPNPAGAIEISDADLGLVAGGEIPASALCHSWACSLGCPTDICTVLCETNVLLCPTGPHK